MPGGDVLDLRHRLPLTWARFTTGAVEQWLVCKVATLTRELPLAVVGLVDAAIAACVATESPSRVLAICAGVICATKPAMSATNASSASKASVSPVHAPSYASSGSSHDERSFASRTSRQVVLSDGRVIEDLDQRHQVAGPPSSGR